MTCSSTRPTLVPREELPELKLRRAELALVRFNNAGAALDLLAEVLQLAPGHARAVGLTERVLDDPEQRRRAAMMLEPLYAAAENWTRLVEILDIEREGQAGPAAVALLVRKAEVQETQPAGTGRGLGHPARGAWRVTRSPRRPCARPSGWRASWGAGMICKRSTRISQANAIPRISLESPTCCRARPGSFRARLRIAALPFAPGGACSTWTSATRAPVRRPLRRWRLSTPRQGTSRAWSMCCGPAAGGPTIIASRPRLVCVSLS